MTQALEIVLLAAGRGTRMRSDLPKVLHELAGRPLVSHVIHTARLLKPGKLCVVYGFGGEALRQTLADENLTFVQQTEQLGTGHAVMQAAARALTPGSVTLVLYGDVPLTRPETLGPLVNAARTGKVGLLTVNLNHPDGYGRIIRDEANRVARVVEQKDATPQERAIHEVNTGILAVPTNLLFGWLSRLTNANAQREYYLTDVVAMAVADGIEIQSSQPAFEWEVLGVNSKIQLAELERLYQQLQARALLEAGVTLMDPERIDIRGELVCGRDVAIDVNCVFEGRVELGDGVAIGPNCVLRNSRVASRTRVDAYTLLDAADVGANCKLGPFSRIRPGTVLGQDVHVGNFVELKNSQVDDGSKINHLSYVGDASVGKKVNIGAGTITCNYDGANKHRTVIEDDAFIGSDSQLVAPVTVGKGATLGAGTTLTRDAPAGELTLSRAKQASVAGWQRPSKKPKGD
jgi:bifunctional UDP-N-acetylglucosamine pyrophosphorylase / glucosamine-1-phosphate N-acetyltransferase